LVSRYASLYFKGTGPCSNIERKVPKFRIKQHLYPCHRWRGRGHYRGRRRHSGVGRRLVHRRRHGRATAAGRRRTWRRSPHRQR